jgi:hypothetical protein
VKYKLNNISVEGGEEQDIFSHLANAGKKNRRKLLKTSDTNIELRDEQS